MSVFSRLNKWRGGVGPLLWDEWATGTHGGTGALNNPWFENQRGHISISSSLYGRLDFVSMSAPCRDNMETTGVLIQELFTIEPNLESREERSSVFISFLFCFVWGFFLYYYLLVFVGPVWGLGRYYKFLGASSLCSILWSPFLVSICPFLDPMR